MKCPCERCSETGLEPSLCLPSGTYFVCQSCRGYGFYEMVSVFNGRKKRKYVKSIQDLNGESIDYREFEKRYIPDL
jgi:hypothetical protein